MCGEYPFHYGETRLAAPARACSSGYFLLTLLDGDANRYGGLLHILLTIWALGLGFVRMNNPRHGYAAVVAILTAQVRGCEMWWLLDSDWLCRPGIE